MNDFRKKEFKKITKNFLKIFIPIFTILTLIFIYRDTYISNLKIQIIFSIFLFGLIISSFAIGYAIYVKNTFPDRLKIVTDIFENSGEAVVLTDKDTEIIYVNKLFCSMTGYKKNELIGKKTSFFNSGKHEEEFYQNMWKSINEKGRWQGEIWDKTKKNEMYPKFLTILSIKGFNETLSGYIGISDDLSDAKNKIDKVKTVKNYDLATSLPNSILMKKLFHKKISALPNIYKKHMYLLSIAITNYDVIKNTLDTVGINDLIVKFVERIKKTCHKEFIFSRINSSEFAIFVEFDCQKYSIYDFAKKITKSLSYVFNIQSQNIYLKTAIGVSSYPKDSDNIDNLLEKANIARSYAEKAGEYEVVIYKEEYKIEYLQKIKIETLLRGALERGEIYLNYQPQVQLDGEKVTGGEALLRWKSPELGNIPPFIFVPIAEQTDMILSIGNWVLDEVCKKISIWRKKYNKDICIAVNISPVQFKKENMHYIIKNVLEKYKIPGHCLEIEITEGVFIDNIDNIKQQLKDIKTLGVKISMDDFGTGYSSLSYLRKFNFDKVKIDKEFVKDYPQKDDGTIAKIIINLSHSLKLKVIAEGVETKEQIKFMKDNSCDVIQGYYYSAPVLEKDFEKFLFKIS